MSALLGEASLPPVQKMVEGRQIAKAAPKPAPRLPQDLHRRDDSAAKRSEEEVR